MLMPEFQCQDSGFSGFSCYLGNESYKSFPDDFKVQARFRTSVLKRLTVSLREHRCLGIIIITRGQLCSIYPASSVLQRDDFSGSLIRGRKRKP